jgi:hypothetical protein
MNWPFEAFGLILKPAAASECLTLSPIARLDSFFIAEN